MAVSWVGLKVFQRADCSAHSMVATWAHLRVHSRVGLMASWTVVERAGSRARTTAVQTVGQRVGGWVGWMGIDWAGRMEQSRADKMVGLTVCPVRMEKSKRGSDSVAKDKNRE